MTKQTIIRQTPLFQGISEREFDSICKRMPFESRTYDKGAIIDVENTMGIVIYGRLQAVKPLMSQKQMYLQQFKSGSIFGVGNLFVENSIPLSHIEVMRPSEVCFLRAVDMMALFHHELILKNYLSFISSRIHYLNQKLEIVSQTTIYDRVKMYLKDQQLIQGSKDLIRLTISKSELAEFIGVSRASLYRVLDEMEAAQEISINHNQIRMLRG